MPRRVIAGQVVRPADLSPNADFSHLEDCHLTGTFGPARSLQYVDMIGGRCDADLRRANIAGFATRNTDCDGIRITDRQADACSYDVIRGHTKGRVRVKLLDLGVSVAVADDLLSFASMMALTDATRRNWKKIITHWMQVTGLGATDIRKILNAGLQDMPRILNMALSEHDPPEKVRAISITSPSQGRQDVPVSTWPQVLRDVAQRHDRWALARASEKFLDSRYPQHAPWACWWEMLFPIPKGWGEPEATLHPDLRYQYGR